MRLLGLVVTTVCVVVSSSALGDRVKQRTGSSPGVTTAAASCADASLQEIHFGRDVTIDQIWVDLRAPVGRPTRDAAIRVQVSAGGAMRRITVEEMGVRGLRFSPGLRGETFRIALDPELTAKTGACVERIVLLRAGQEIASVQP